uniref:Uncharacterized protein n=1 Tax=Aegilops tauschii subsp. strangulata TaxID=200361 RepID=A0A453NJ09_AEGTS
APPSSGWRGSPARCAGEGPDRRRPLRAEWELRRRRRRRRRPRDRARRHALPLPPSASAPLADRSSHSHEATTSRTAGDGLVQSREDRAVWDAETTLPEKESPTTSRPPLACTLGRLVRRVL